MNEKVRVALPRITLLDFALGLALLHSQNASGREYKELAERFKLRATPECKKYVLGLLRTTNRKQFVKSFLETLEPLV